MAEDPLRSFYTRARNRLRKHSPDSMLAHGIGALHKIHTGGVAVMRHYQPWNILLALKWIMQEADGVSHRRPPATLDDFHAILNILHEADGNVRMPSDYEHVFLFMRQLAFQQFWLQQAACGEDLVRQDLLFSSLPADHWLQREFRRLTGVSPGEFLDLAYATFTLILQTPSPEFIERQHYNLIAPGLLPGALDGFLRQLSRRGEELHAKLSQPPYSGMSVSDQQVLPTPLLDSPLLQTAAGNYVVISPTLLMRSLESVVYRTLRRNDPSAFGPRFGPVFERYVGRVLDSAGVAYFDETRLQALLPGTGKCVDFLIQERDCTILIDAKGIELSALGRVSRTGELLFRTIKDSAVKAIEQGMETLRRIERLPTDSPIADRADEKFVIVVTFDDLFLGSNYEFGALFGNALVPRLQGQFGGTLPLPMEHIFFVSINEFERLLVRLEGGTNTIGSILRHARSNDADGRTRKFHFIQHLESIAKQSTRLPLLQAGLETLCDRCIGRVPVAQRTLRP